MVTVQERDLQWPVEDDATATRSSGFSKRTAVGASDSIQDRRLHRAIARAKAGDQEAVRYLYCRYADNVYGYVCKIVRDDHEAEDITQNVFAKLMSVIGKYERRSVPFSAWILRIARNAALDHLRQRRAVPVEEVRLPAESEPTDDGRGETLRDVLTELPEEQRNVVLMRHVMGLSPGEIAEHVGKTEAAVHGLHHRGRAAAREELTARAACPATMP
jgi:RNA polymerase sigma-70 factor, ECF subfamily